MPSATPTGTQERRSKTSTSSSSRRPSLAQLLQSDANPAKTPDDSGAMTPVHPQRFSGHRAGRHAGPRATCVEASIRSADEVGERLHRGRRDHRRALAWVPPRFTDVFGSGHPLSRGDLTYPAASSLRSSRAVGLIGIPTALMMSMVEDLSSAAAFDAASPSSSFFAGERRIISATSNGSRRRHPDRSWRERVAQPASTPDITHPDARWNVRRRRCIARLHDLARGWAALPVAQLRRHSTGRHRAAPGWSLVLDGRSRPARHPRARRSP